MSLQKHNKDTYPAIRSFVRHHGRMTAGQRHALGCYWQDYGIDFSRQVLNLKAFGDFSQVVLEIGFGNGETLVDMAASYPDILFIGVEVHRPGVGRTLMLAQARDLKNLRLVEYDAVAFIDTMLPANCLDRVQIYFPDPWHKRRHHKRRLIQNAFCQQLHRVLKLQGLLHIATDWFPYAEHCIKVLVSMDNYRNLAVAGDYVEKPDYRRETKFERRGRRLGHEVKDLLFAAT